MNKKRDTTNRVIIETIDDPIADALRQKSKAIEKKEGFPTDVSNQFYNMASDFLTLESERPNLYRRALQGDFPVGFIVNYKDKFNTLEQVQKYKRASRTTTKTPVLYRLGCIVLDKEYATVEFSKN